MNNAQQNKEDFGLIFGEAKSYRLLPLTLTRLELRNSTPYWRIELSGLTDKPIGLDLIGDVIVGRGGEVDIDLNQYAGYLEGVSRKHILLRPTADGVIVIDLKSTNGTSINGQLLDYAGAINLEDGSTITLGNLSFTIKLVDHATLGELRIHILKEAMNEDPTLPPDVRPTRPLPSIRKLTGADEDETPETVLMHFRNLMRYPEAISQWMDERKNQASA